MMRWLVLASWRHHGLVATSHADYASIKQRHALTALLAVKLVKNNARTRQIWRRS
jgi:hypothetical protein